MNHSKLQPQDYPSWHAIPASVKVAFEYRGEIIINDWKRRVWAQKCLIDMGYVELVGVVIDSSEYHARTLLKEMWTYYPTFMVAGNYTLIMFPLANTAAAAGLQTKERDHG